MVRPVRFRSNEQTAVNNYFQDPDPSQSAEAIQQLAVQEFDSLVSKLREEGINVIVFSDTTVSNTPDSIFPNNWISTHDDGSVLLYPMFAENRRIERRDDIVDALTRRFLVSSVHSFVHWEEKNLFLEGTGSLILDRPHKIAYAALSERTSTDVIAEFELRTGYRTEAFHALQTVGNQRLPIYHTNVMMSVGEQFVLICLASIDDKSERERLQRVFDSTGKEVIEISEAQAAAFAGNILQVRNPDGHLFIVMSQSAHDCLLDWQREKLTTHGKIVSSPIPTIERLGGGSVRCMIAEVFLPKILMH